MKANDAHKKTLPAKTGCGEHFCYTVTDQLNREIWVSHESPYDFKKEAQALLLVTSKGFDDS